MPPVPRLRNLALAGGATGKEAESEGWSGERLVRAALGNKWKPPGKGLLGMSKVKGNSPDSSELPWVWRRVGTVTVRLIVVSLSLERCPRIQSNCEFKERDECSKNKKCLKHEKCCFFSCGRKCINLQQGKQILRASITNPLPISFPSAPLGWPCPLFTKGWSLSKIAGLGKLEI